MWSVSLILIMWTTSIVGSTSYSWLSAQTCALGFLTNLGIATATSAETVFTQQNCLQKPPHLPGLWCLSTVLCVAIRKPLSQSREWHPSYWWGTPEGSTERASASSPHSWHNSRVKCRPWTLRAGKDIWALPLPTLQARWSKDRI